MANLDWLVVRDLFEIESATFWKNAPEIETGEIVPEECRTEVFLLPAASHVEKEGTFTQTQRVLQWREKAVEPVDDCRSELWFFYHLGRMVRERLAGSTAERDRPLLDLAWDYPTHGERDEPSAESVLMEINGVEVATGRPLSSYTEMKDDGSTLGGCWIYTGVYKDGVNQAARRTPAPRADLGGSGVGLGVAREPPHALQPRLGRPRGQAVERAQEVRLVGRGVRRLDRARRPRLREGQAALVPARRTAPAASRGSPATTRSSCRATARAGCTCRSGLVDGPMPTHYEPAESIVPQPAVRPAGQPHPQGVRAPDNRMNPSPPEQHSEVFPFVFTHQPADRAPHGRRDEPPPGVPVRAAARDVRRGLPASWPPSVAWSTWAGATWSPRGRRSRGG